MTEQNIYGADPLPDATRSLLKATGAIKRITPPLETTLQCAGCIFGGDRFYMKRAEECGGMPHNSAVRSTASLKEAGALINEERVRTGTQGGAIVYNVAPEIKASYPNSRPLPGCIMNPRTQ